MIFILDRRKNIFQISFSNKTDLSRGIYISEESSSSFYSDEEVIFFKIKCSSDKSRFFRDYRLQISSSFFSFLFGFRKLLLFIKIKKNILLSLVIFCLLSSFFIDPYFENKNQKKLNYLREVSDFSVFKAIISKIEPPVEKIGVFFKSHFVSISGVPLFYFFPIKGYKGDFAIKEKSIFVWQGEKEFSLVGFISQCNNYKGEAWYLYNFQEDYQALILKEKHKRIIPVIFSQNSLDSSDKFCSEIYKYE